MCEVFNENFMKINSLSGLNWVNWTEYEWLYERNVPIL